MLGEKLEDGEPIITPARFFRPAYSKAVPLGSANGRTAR
jgi:hypothetical protein